MELQSHIILIAMLAPSRSAASVYKVLLEEVQVVLDVCQEVFVALGARSDGLHGLAQPQLHVRICRLCLGALRSTPPQLPPIRPTRMPKLALLKPLASP